MGIFKRISDIISANLEEMTERFEDPETMLKQAIREMESAIAEATDGTAKAMANEKLLAKQLGEHEALVKRWQEKAETAVEADKDELARDALARKHEHEKLLVALGEQLSAAQQASQVMRQQLEAMKAKLAEAKRNLATLATRKRTADFRKKMDSMAVEVSSPSDDAFVKFERMREKVEQAEAEAEAHAELRGQARPEPAGAAADDPDIEAQLAALKKKKKA